METITVQGKEKKVTLLWSTVQIQQRIKALAKEIADFYRPILERNKSRELVLVGILNGAIYFLADLSRELSQLLPPNRIRIDTLGISSYGKGTVHGELKIEKDLKDPVANCEVLILEDIIDTGYTSACLTDLMRHKKARNVNICTLIDKVARRISDVSISFSGFELEEDEFIVGYGLDWAGLGRVLPFIARLDDLD